MRATFGLIERMNRDALDKLFERGILGLVLALLVFAPLAMGAVDAWEFLVVQALAIGVLALWTLRVWFGPKPQLLWPPICWVVVAFVVYAVARYLTADIEYVARQELIQVLVCAFVFFAVVNNLYRQELSQVISFTMIFLAMGIAGYAVFQFFTHTARVWNVVTPYQGRAPGTFISPNNLAGFLELLLPLATGYVLAGRMRPVTRIFLGYAALVMLAGLVVTFSRGGWAAALLGIVAVVLVLLSRRSYRIPALVLTVFLAAGGAFFVKNYLAQTVAYQQRVQETVAQGHIELDRRTDLWRAAAQMWRDHPWFGVGPAHYDYRFRQYRSERLQGRPDRAHNDYLNLLADWGTTGGMIVLAGMGVFVAGLWQTRRHVQRAENDFGSGFSNRFAFFIGASAALLALAAHSFVDFNLHIPANALLGVTLLALLTSNLRFATEKYWVNLRTPSKAAFTLALAAGIAFLGWQEWRRGNETAWLRRAQSAELSLLDRAKLLEKAFAAEPKNFQTAYDIGEAYRMQSFEGDPDYRDEAETALRWYARARALDRYDGYNDLRTGMCLDWLDRHGESEKFYRDAETLDPNGYYTIANIGWHYAQVGDYAAAQEWFRRSLRIGWIDNVISESYLELTRQRMLEEASGKRRVPGGF